MKRLIFGFLSLFFVVSSMAEVRILPVNNGALAATYRAIDDRRDAWRNIDRLLQAQRAPTPYSRIIFAECGMENAYFSQSSREIVFCYELAEGFARASGGNWSAVSDAIAFIVMHEYGHALIDASSAAVLGREEDAADQIATMLVRKLKGQVRVAQSLLMTSMQGRQLLYLNTKNQMADEHSLPPQRKANVLCWLLGDSMEVMQRVISNGDVPKERASRCHDEIQKAERAVNALMTSN